MTLVQKNAKKIYIGENIDTWELFDETNAAASTSWSGGVVANVNWKLKRVSYTFWGWNWNYSITTRTAWGNTYNVFQANECHWNIHIWLSNEDFNAWHSHETVKVIVDYAFVSPAGSYWDSCWWLAWTSATAWWRMERSSWSRQTTWLWQNYNGGTPYSMEYIITTSDNSVEYILTNLNDSSSITWTFTRNPWQETSSSYMLNWWGPCLWMLITDYCSWGIRWWMWDIHLYYLN